MNPVRTAPGTDGRLLAALGLISAAATAQQIALMQVLGWMHWHHFAYMIVAVALLGFGIAGTVLSLARECLVRNWKSILPWLILGCALTIPSGVRLARAPALAVDLPLIFFDPGNVWRLVALCVLLLPPFFCAGLVTGLLLTVNARHAGRFYAASLAGAGVGGLIGLTLVANVSPPRLSTAVATLALAAASCLWPRLRRVRSTEVERLDPKPLNVSGTNPKRVEVNSLHLSERRVVAPLRLGRVARIATLVSAAVLFGFWQFPGKLHSSQFKPLSRTLDLPGARVIAERPGVHGWVQVVAAPALRPAPATSLQFQGEIPVQPAVFVNGLGYGSLLDAAALRNPAWLDYTTDAVAFAVTRPKRVLLLENGPGGWAAIARQHGATHIDVVEPNRALVELLTRGEPPFAPEWRLPGVNLIIATGRAEMSRTLATYDLIRFPSVGALGGTAGLASASEQFLLTREAFTDAWHRLSPGGVVAITAWMDFPERNSLRLVATLAEALESVGATPRTSLAAIRGWATVTFLARSPANENAPAWNASDLDALRQFCRERGFDPLLLPDLIPDERELNHAWQNPRFFERVDALVSGPREPVYQNHEFVVEPATDARPYFSQFLRWSGWERVKETFGARSVPFFELGSWVVALTFIVLLVLAAAGIALPLVRLGWRGRGKTRVFLYFGGLGAGYMFAEIGLMLRAHALLGSPVLAAALVITALLIASGLGSLWSDRLTPTTRTQRAALLTIAGSLLIASALLALLTPLARTWPAAAGIALLLVIVTGLGAALGTAFPLGLRWLEAGTPAHVPWAWAVNGCISVATPAGAMLLAMRSGFGALFAAGAAAYAIALLGTFLSADSATRSASGSG
ncbi:MAG: spermidine synthase [Opitutaceae bacterium]